MPFIKKTLIFLSITILCLYVLDKFYKKRFENIYIEKPNYVANVSNKNYDYIVGGSSRVHNNFNTRLFDSICNLNGFNIGYEGSALAQNYLTLYLFLKNGNKTKNYLQQVEDNFLIDPKKGLTYPFQDYLFVSEIGDCNVDECFEKNSPFLKFFIWKYIPFIKYAEFNNYYSLKKIFSKFSIDSNIIKEKGYHKLELQTKKNFPAVSYPSIHDEIPVDPSNIYYLNKIKELCTSHQINFIIYSAPLHQKSYLAYQSKNLHNALVNYVSNSNIKYLNFMADKSFSNDSLFYDETHLNSIGTDLFMIRLSDSLKHILNK